MAISVVMPALEMAQETGKLISWLKQEGETVAKGEPLLEIETDKAVIEIESPGEGILAAVKVRAGAEVPVGQTIAWIVQPGETAPSEEAPVCVGEKNFCAGFLLCVSVFGTVNSASSGGHPDLPESATSSRRARRGSYKGARIGARRRNSRFRHSRRCGIQSRRGTGG